MNHIRNFVIIAHIDHGKSTLADRFLETTDTIDKRHMKEQYLDQLELERERGITIKMAPVRMKYTLHDTSYTLNLIDTPGHSDFSYEVSRALAAVEGALLLVDASQGIQAQTIANLRLAKDAGLTVIGAVNKVDLFKDTSHDHNRLRGVQQELAELLGTNEDSIFLVSGKTGEGVPALLQGIIKNIPPPSGGASAVCAKALIFDSFYDNHKGVIASVRIFSGTVFADDALYLIETHTESTLKELGIFTPELKSQDALHNGEIGYLATGIKDPEKIRIGDTVISGKALHESIQKASPLAGYKEPKPVVFVSFYPEDNNDYERLMRGLQKLRLNDSSLTVEPDQNEVLGRGFKVGFLGRLHFEITSERVRREYGVSTVNTFPSVLYRVKTPRGWSTFIKPEELPDDFLEIWEPMVFTVILVPPAYVSNLFPLYIRFRIKDVVTEIFHDRVKIQARMPLAELVSDFDDQLKSATQGYASFSYELSGYEKTDVVRVDIYIAKEFVSGLSRFFPKTTYEREARRMVERLKKVLPQQQFAQPIQAIMQGRVIAREDIPALRKDVTDYLYGGDRTRKMKLWQKQKRGKKKLQERAEAKLTPEIFKELLKK